MMTELISLQEEALQCTKCQLAKSRNKLVFGEGNESAGIFIIGEAPGYDEDRQGRPFVGKSGQLLDKILAACDFKRQEHVYIGNILKCRPPGNRNPSPEEAASCMPYLLKQIELVDPKIIILLGASALKHMIGPELRITKIRGQWIEHDGRLFMPVYHPSALLRNPALKKESWEDFKNVVRKYRELVDELVDKEHRCEYV
jgi:DNA polymerase